MRRALLGVGLVLSVLATLYSLGGVMMAYWVAAVPGNSPERIRLNFLVWVPATVVFAALSGLLLWRLLKRSGV